MIATTAASPNRSRGSQNKYAEKEDQTTNSSGLRAVVLALWSDKGNNEEV